MDEREAAEVIRTAATGIDYSPFPKGQSQLILPVLLRGTASAIERFGRPSYALTFDELADVSQTWSRHLHRTDMWKDAASARQAYYRWAKHLKEPLRTDVGNDKVSFGVYFTVKLVSGAGALVISACIVDKRGKVVVPVSTTEGRNVAYRDVLYPEPEPFPRGSEEALIEGISDAAARASLESLLFKVPVLLETGKSYSLETFPLGDPLGIGDAWQGIIDWGDGTPNEPIRSHGHTSHVYRNTGGFVIRVMIYKPDYMRGLSTTASVVVVTPLGVLTPEERRGARSLAQEAYERFGALVRKASPEDFPRRNVKAADVVSSEDAEK